MSIPVLQLISRFWVGGAERQFIERLRAHPEGSAPTVAVHSRAIVGEQALRP